jgi:putative membrane protein
MNMMIGRGSLARCADGIAGGNGSNCGSGYFHHGTLGMMHSGFGICIGIGLIILFAIIVYLVVRKKKNKSGKNTEAIEILKIKYVQGEITEEEYLKRKDFLDKESKNKK